MPGEFRLPGGATFDDPNAFAMSLRRQMQPDLMEPPQAEEGDPQMSLPGGAMGKIAMVIAALAAIAGKNKKERFKPLEMLLSTQVGKNASQRQAMLDSLRERQIGVQERYAGARETNAADPNNRYRYMRLSKDTVFDRVSGEAKNMTPEQQNQFIKDGLLVGQEVGPGGTTETIVDETPMGKAKREGEEAGTARTKAQTTAIEEKTPEEVALLKQRVEESKARTSQNLARVDKIVAEAKSAGKASGKPLMAGEITAISDIRGSLASLASLRESFDDSGWWASGPIAGTLLQAIPGSDAQKLDRK